MKKILSIFLSATLIVTCLLSIPFMTSATSTPVGEKVLVLNTDAITDTSWLKGNSYDYKTDKWTEKTAFWNNTYYQTPLRGYSYELLSQANTVDGITDVQAFEWKFKTKLNQAWAKVGFLFNVDTQRTENQTVLDEFSTVSDLSNCFAVVITGTQNKNYYPGHSNGHVLSKCVIKDGLRPYAINILVPDASTGALVPLNATEYTAEEIKKVYDSYNGTEPVTLSPEGSYLQIDGDKIDISDDAYCDYSIKLVGNRLNVSISLGDVTIDEEFVLPAESLAKAPSGDFAVANGGWIDGSYDRTRNAQFKNMTIYSYGMPDAEKNLLFNSTALDANGYVWADNNNAPTDVDVEPSSTDGALKLPGGIATTPILNQNGYEDNILKDFTWEFKYKADDAANNETSFLFHVDTERQYGVNGAYYPTMLLSGKNMGLKNSINANRTARLYMAVTLYGSADKFKTQANAWQNALTLDWTDRDAVYQNVQQFTTTNADYGATTKPVSYLVVKTVDNDGNPVANIRNDVYYNIKVSKAGNSVTYAIWQDGFKAETYSVAVCTLNETQLTRCASGDFAIVQENATTSGSVKDMKIYDGIDASAEDYSAYAGYKTEYTFDETVGDLTDNANGKITVVDGMLNVPTDGGTIRVYGLDAKNNNLGDFILKYDLTEYSEYSGNHDRLYFRRTDENNTYRIRFRMYGGQNSANYNPGTEYGNGTASSYGNGLLYLEKIVDGTTVVLDKVPIGNGLIRKGTMTVKISAIGDKIKVWYAGDGVVYNEPLMSVTDDSYSTGFVQYDFYGGDRYVDNIEIYDLTAKAAAEKIAATDVNAVNCTKKADYTDILALHDAQIAKFDTAIADKAEEIITALDHNHQVDAEASSTATYFVAGKEVKVCKYCNDTVETTLPVAEDALIKDECKEEFANGNLTITLAYSEALIEDIDKGAVISFNYSIGNYSPEKPIEIDGTTGAVITLEGFNADRLKAELTYYLTAAYDGVDTTKLADDTTRKLTVANDVELDSKTSAFVNALNADGANTVVSAEDVAVDTVYFTENTITADLKEGTMVLNFIASDELVAKLGENKAYTRTNKITVTIDGVANKYEFTPEVMRKSTTINISGLSFEQLNGRVTIKVEFIYEAATEKNISDTIVFEGSAAVAATNTPVANAFAEYIA